MHCLTARPLGVFPRPRKRGTGEGRHHSTIPFSTHPPKHPHPLFLVFFFYSLKRSVELTNTVLTALHCSLFTALCSLLTALYSLITDHCSLGSHENFNVAAHWDLMKTLMLLTSLSLLFLGQYSSSSEEVL